MAGMSVGGSAAAGLEAGFGMGLRADEANERRKQREIDNARQAQIDTERRDQTQRTNARQDKADDYAEDDRALTALNSEMSDHALYGAGIAAQYGGPAKVPGDVGKAYATKASEIGSRRAALLRKRYEPVVKKEQQWAADTSSRIATGQLSMDDLTPAETVRLLQATTRRPITDFLTAPGGKSVVGQAIADTTAGLETQNNGLVLQGANTLLAPDMRTGLGQVASDGSQITGKSIAAFVPAPGRGAPAAPQANPIQGLTAALNAATAPQQPGAAPQQPGAAPQQAASGLTPGEDPDMVMPVLQVTARHPDGTEVTYHAPVTKGRGVGPDDEVHPGFKMSDAVERMGKLGTLEAWANTPQARAKIEQGLKELGGDANSFLGAYYAMHGDAKALLPPGSEDPTSKKIAAVQKFAKDNNLTFEQAARQIDGKSNASAGTGPLGQYFADVDASDLSPADKAAAKRAKALGVKAASETAPATGAPAPASGTGMGTKVDPATQSTRDEGRAKILQDERKAQQKRVDEAATPEAKERALGDLRALDKEIAKVGKPAPGGATSAALGDAPAPAPDAGKRAVDFWANAVIAGDKDWQIGLGRSKSGSALIEAVKRRVPELAAEYGLQPSDIGTTRAQSAALSSTMKDLTKRAEAVELFSSKVDKDMKTFDGLLDKASTGSPLLISKPINYLRRQFSDPDLAQLDLAAKQVGAEYERLITGGTLSVAQLHAGASEDAKKLINGDMPPDQARAVMKVMRQEMQNAKDAAHESQSRITEQMRALGGPRKPGAGVGDARPKPPAVGDVLQGYKFKGGDPSKQSNWEKQ